MSDEIKKTVLNTLAEPIANSAKNITDKPTQNIGTTLADIWYLVFGGISQAAEKRKLKYSYALQEFEKELKEKISKIPEDKLVEPDMQIIAPALEASKYCVEKEELRHMFSNLIISSLNSDYIKIIRPSFTDTLKQLSSYDAKFLHHFFPCKTIGHSFDISQLSFLCADANNKFSTEEQAHYFIPESTLDIEVFGKRIFFPFDSISIFLKKPITNSLFMGNDELTVYEYVSIMNNLNRLGLLNIREGTVSKGDINKIKDLIDTHFDEKHDIIYELYSYCTHEPNRIKVIIVTLSTYGIDFMKICD
ncbi:Abi-alpha family protein [Thomasclavelia cocleata]|jgi:hypothetical protein|uniref:Abi-alpha family protein n=1 Tax=Thomasclavelia cocleata TaxID=69824 RepID=UPI00255AAB38|nr:Abi-alpha family protein [Thomasclavelia cocleata]